MPIYSNDFAKETIAIEYGSHLCNTQFVVSEEAAELLRDSNFNVGVHAYYYDNTLFVDNSFLFAYNRASKIGKISAPVVNDAITWIEHKYSCNVSYSAIYKNDAIEHQAVLRGMDVGVYIAHSSISKADALNKLIITMLTAYGQQ